jgi:hypothetical protein
VRPHHLIALSALVASAHAAAAQSAPNIAAPKQAAQRAATAANAQLSAQTGQAVPQRSGPPAATTQRPAAAPVAAAGAARSAAPGAARTATPTVLGVTPVALPGGPQVTREVYTYDDGRRRDPFFSLILTEDLRPLLSDLKLVGVLYEPSGRRSVAIFRDVLTNTQYRVQTGMPLGRMRVAQIKPKGVIFTIDEFGLSRQDSLMLSDSLKARIR